MLSLVTNVILVIFVMFCYFYLDKIQIRNHPIDASSARISITSSCGMSSSSAIVSMEFPSVHMLTQRVRKSSL